MSKATVPTRLPGARTGAKLVKFGDMAQNVTDRVDPAEADGDVYVGLEHLDAESLKIRRWGKPADVIGQKLRFRKGDIIFGKRRAYQRKLAVAECNGICSAHAMVVRAKPKVVLPEFLPFLMQSDLFMDRAVEISVGSLSPTINWKTLKVQEFSLPPLDEQRRIAEILWATDGANQANRKVLDDLHQLSGAEAISLFSAGRSGDGCRMASLGEVADVRYGLTVDASRRKMAGTMPYLRVANVQRGRLDLAEVKEIGCDQRDISECVLERGDVLVVEGHADPTEIGRAAIWGGEINRCLHQNHILRVRTSSALLPEYLLAYLNSPRGRSHFRRFAKSSSGLYTINSTVLRKMIIPLRATSKQQEAVDSFRELEHRVTELHGHAERLIVVKQAIMGLFFGDKHVQ